MGKQVGKLSSVFPEDTRRSIAALVDRGQVNAPETRYEVPIFVGARGEETTVLMLMTLCNQLEEVSEPTDRHPGPCKSLGQYSWVEALSPCSCAVMVCQQITIPKVIFLGAQKEQADSTTFVQLAYYLHNSKAAEAGDDKKVA